MVCLIAESGATAMTELCREILENYQVRKTKKQKRAFTALLQNHIPDLQVQERHFPKSRNLVIGDPETASVILGAHYDTCPVLPFPNFVTPKRPGISIFYSIVVVFPLIAAIFLLNFIDFWDPLARYCLSLAAYAALMWLMLAGPANKHTANDNTSGVITLLEIYQSLSPLQRERVCFVFFDNEEKGVIGSAQFRKKYKKIIIEKLLINFDCVSDGDYFLLAISKKANQKYHVPIAQAFPSASGKYVLLENLKKVYYPSDQSGFPIAIAVAALKCKKPFGYYLDRIHTNRDTVFDESNIAYLAEHTVRFIDSISTHRETDQTVCI